MIHESRIMYYISEASKQNCATTCRQISLDIATNIVFVPLSKRVEVGNLHQEVQNDASKRQTTHAFC